MCIKLSKIKKQVSNINVYIPSTFILRSINNWAARHLTLFDSLLEHKSLEKFTNSSGSSINFYSSSLLIFKIGIMICKNISKLTSMKNFWWFGSFEKQLIISKHDFIMLLMLLFCYKLSKLGFCITTFKLFTISIWNWSPS